MESCAECGAPMQPRSCDDLFHTLLALDHSRQEPWGPLHGVSVSCFLLQHHSRIPDDDAMPWALVRGYLEGGLDEIEQLVENARRGNSHRLNAGPARVAHAAASPRATAPPSHFAVTIEDVALDGSFPAAGFAERVKDWSAATVDGWSRVRERDLPGRTTE